MSENSAIEWTDHTFNPWLGCTKVGLGCDHCYAEALMDTRYGKVHWGVGQPRVRTAPANWKKPLQWERQAASFYECAECSTDCRWRGLGDGESCGGCGGHVVKARQRVFCASLADVFDNEVDAAWRADLFRLSLSTPSLDWLLLSKRIGNIAAMLKQARSDAVNASPTDKTLALWLDDWLRGPPPANVWLGATVVNQEEADRDIPKLLATPARVRFLSIEPMLGAVDLRLNPKGPAGAAHWPATAKETTQRGAGRGAGDDARCDGGPAGPGGIDWVIAGGESGPGARPAHPDWFRSLRDQCAAAGVAFHFKQWGEWAEFDADGLPGTRRAVEGDPEYEDQAAQCDAFIRHDGFVVHSMREVSRDDAYRGLIRPGKKAAGRLLDGVQHDGFPA